MDARSRTAVFYRGERMPTADAATFVVRAIPSVEDGDASDGSRAYELGKVFTKTKPQS